MTKKQYRRQLDYQEGYRRGYYNGKTLFPKDRIRKSDAFMRGFYQGRTDYQHGESPDM